MYSSILGCLKETELVDFERNRCDECDDFYWRRVRRASDYPDYSSESSSFESETSSSESNSNTNCNTDEVEPKSPSPHGSLPWQISLSTDGARCGASLITMSVNQKI